MLLQATVTIGQEVPEFGRQAFHSAGFNISVVSGVGLSYRHHFSGPGLVQFTGGLITSGSGSHTSLGVEYQHELSKKGHFRYYIGAGAGVYSSPGATATAAGIGIGLELPILGDSILESVTGGMSLFYPVAYSGQQDRASVGFGGSLYFYYNF